MDGTGRAGCGRTGEPDGGSTSGVAGRAAGWRFGSASEGEAVVRWWCSIVVDGEDGRPLRWPPPDGVLGFWITGHFKDAGGWHTNVCLWVEAPDAAAVRRVVEAGWPDLCGRPWRIESHEQNNPPGDRFPAPDWSVTLGRWPLVTDQGK